MFRPIKSCVLLLACVMGVPVKAVQISQNGMGEVLIYPYYTVNNNLNTLYSVINTTPDAKAIKVSFLESEFGLDVLTFQVYLSAYDVWTGVLVPASSTIGNHGGEPTAVHLTNDTTCAPFLYKAGQEFLPYLIDTDLDPSNRSMARSTSGHMVMVEMGVLTGEPAEWVDHSHVGVPNNCVNLESEWQDNEWNQQQLDAPSGGLVGTASLINVAEGIDFAYDAIAIDNFWPGDGLLTSPGDLEPNLNSGSTESTIFMDDGEVLVNEWSTGYEAISAVLMHTEVYNEYMVDTLINGRSEWVLTFPTKKFHTDPAQSAATLPFKALWDGQSSCVDFDLAVWDREQQREYPWYNKCTPCPPRPPVQMCHSIEVLEYQLPTDEVGEFSRVLGAKNKLTYINAAAVTESGWAHLQLSKNEQHMNTDSGVVLQGLPVTGFSVQQYTNAGAALGLLAQFGNLYAHKGLLIKAENETKGGGHE